MQKPNNIIAVIQFLRLSNLSGSLVLLYGTICIIENAIIAEKNRMAGLRRAAGFIFLNIRFRAERTEILQNWSEERYGRH